VELHDVRRSALALPEAAEEPHHDMTSFRVRGKIFATVTADEEHLHVFVDEAGVREAVAASPGSCTELWWGKKLSGVRVSIADADEAHVAELLEDAWRRRAPKRLVSERDAGA
jgi:hypothetical protein